MKYNVGDKVRIVSNWNMSTNENSDGAMDHWLGRVMTIRCIDGNCYRMCEDERESGGWYWNEHCIAGLAMRIEKTEKIVITTDGVETLARLYDGNGKVVKSATAKCSPDDEFDFEIGAKLAMERLTGKEEPKKENPFKVGDIVRIGKAPHKEPAIRGMREYAGQYGIVRNILSSDRVAVRMFSDIKIIDCWHWHVDDVELIERRAD